MRIKNIYCFKCKSVFPFEKIIFSCPKCGYSLDVDYNYSEIKQIIKQIPEFKSQKISHWKYWMFYPLIDLKNIVSLQEGNTPLIQSKKFKNLLFKFEGCNPSGSFKDRGTTVEVSRARELGIKKIACASTGNMGASISAYCARAGINATVFAPSITSNEKLYQMKMHNAKIVKVNGTYEEAVKKTKQLRDKNGIYLMGDYPLRGEGEKSLGYEIIDQFNWIEPKKVFLPIGNGTMCYAVFKAFKELKEVELIKRIPQIIGVQAKGCNPVFKAFKENLDYIPVIKKPKTIASAVACGNPVDGLEALNAIRKSNGECLQASEQEILQARKELALEGIFAEPSGALSFAGFKQLNEKTHSICIVSGHGLKQLV